MFFFYLVVFFFFNSSKVYSEEEINIDKCIEQRTQQYPLNGYKQICVYSPDRTGSTLVFNILRILFEDEKNKNRSGWRNKIRKNDLIVCKTHAMPPLNNEIAYVFTMRNPIDACFSLCRLSIKDNSAKNIKMYAKDQMDRWNGLERLLSHNLKVVVLKYEEFNDNMDHIFEKLEEEFSIVIDEKDKSLLRKALCKENVLKTVDKLENFSEYESINLFHGSHIDQGEISEEDKALIKRQIAKKFVQYKKELNKWGYFIEN